MLDAQQFRAAIFEFKARVDDLTLYEKLESLSGVITQLETETDFFNCLVNLYSLRITLELHYHFIRYIYIHHNPKTAENKLPWGLDFQGYVINVLKLQKDEELFKELILSLYTDDKDQIEALAAWLNEPCPLLEDNHQKIGFGMYGIIYHQANAASVLKLLNKLDIMENNLCASPEILRGLFNEAILLRLLKGAPHIVQVNQAELLSDSPRIALEYADAGNFLNFLLNNRNYVEQQHLDFIAQILTALVYMHSLDIYHREIKLENLLVCRNGAQGYTLKLGDFGAVIKGSHIKWDTAIRTTYDYAAPEVLAPDGMPIDLGKADIFSVAIVWAMIFHQNKVKAPYPMLFKEYTLDIIRNHVVTKNLRPLHNIPNSCQNTLNLMWDANPTNRPNAAEAQNKIQELIKAHIM